MARYIGPTCKLARREGADLSLKSPARAIESFTLLELFRGGQDGRRPGAEDSPGDVVCPRAV